MQLAADGAFVVPGHDPLVARPDYPTLPGDAAGLAFTIA